MNRDVNKLKKIFKNCGLNCGSQTKGKAIDELYALSESGQLGSGGSGGSFEPKELHFWNNRYGEVCFSFNRDVKEGDVVFTLGSGTQDIYNENGGFVNQIEYFLQIEKIDSINYNGDDGKVQSFDLRGTDWSYQQSVPFSYGYVTEYNGIIERQ